jgi:hypothetical protein
MSAPRVERGHFAPPTTCYTDIHFREAHRERHQRKPDHRGAGPAVEVQVPDAELEYTHDPRSLDGLEAALKERAREKHQRGETMPVVGPVHETELTTWEQVGPAANRARDGLVTLYTADDTPDDT